jgi:hypothetical protein
MKFGLNTYVYAPKDDVKHRSRWRDLYSHEESAELSQLIHLSKRYGIKFVYALSPGLDITYSAEKDLNALKRKFDQVVFCLFVKSLFLMNIQFSYQVLDVNIGLCYLMILKVKCLNKIKIIFLHLLMHKLL